VGQKISSAIACTGTDNQNNETQHYRHQNHKRPTEKNRPWLTKQTKPWFGMPLMTSGQETEWVQFLQSWVWPETMRQRPCV